MINKLIYESKIFLRNLFKCLYINDCYEQKSSERSCAKLCRASALGPYFFTSKTDLNNLLSF